MEELASNIDLGETLYQYHRIAMDYHWDRERIRSLSKSEREMWANLIEDELEERMKKGVPLL